MFEDLKERGFFQQCTHSEELAKKLKKTVSVAMLALIRPETHYM